METDFVDRPAVLLACLPERALSRLVAMSASYALIIGVGTSGPWIAAAGLRGAHKERACIPDGVAGREVWAPRDHHGLVICRREWHGSRTEPGLALSPGFSSRSVVGNARIGPLPDTTELGQLLEEYGSAMRQTRRAPVFAVARKQRLFRLHADRLGSVPRRAASSGRVSR